MKIKVLHVVLSLDTGGLENGIVNLVNGADNSKFQVDVLCLRNDGELVKRIKNPDSTVYFDNVRDPSILVAARKISTACKKHDYQILHTHGWATMLPAYLSRRGRSRPYLVNGEHGTYYINSMLQKQVQRFLFCRMDLNLSVSRNLANKLGRAFNLRPERFLAIVNGVDSTRFGTDLRSGSEIREELGIRPAEFVVGSVGRLVEVKNYPCLVRAFHLFSKNRQDVRLLLVGEGPQRVKIEQMIDEYGLGGKVILAGRREDIPALLSSMDVFVLPSFSEGLSNTILEAMCAGLPIIASNVGGNPELIAPGIVGELFESDNERELSTYLENWYSNPEKREQMSISARAHAEKNFTLASMIEKYENAYLRLVGETGPVEAC